ncbi:MAG: hypothetical protein ACO1SV_00355 [Fimbriimonas sp.]
MPGLVPPPRSAARLEALADGYSGLTGLLVANLVLGYIHSAVMIVSIPAGIVGFAVVCLVVFPFLRPKIRKIAFGMGWPDSCVTALTIGMGFTSVLFCGIVNHFVLGKIAADEMSRTYGLRPGFFGVDEELVDETVARLLREEALWPYPPSSRLQPHPP